MAEGIVTYGEREPVDAGLAAKQHAAYVGAIADAGWAIREVSPADALPDSAQVCSCNAVTKGAICAAIDGGAHDVPAVKGCTRAGTIRSGQNDRDPSEPSHGAEPLTSVRLSGVRP